MSDRETSAAITIERVSKSFGATRAVDDLSLQISAGGFFALLGPSGCGKTTLMRLIAGFETPDTGTIHVGGNDMNGRPPERRPVNMMFQSYALFPHMSVAGNISYGLRRAGQSRGDVAQRVAELLRLVQLDGLADRKPDQLSGGQRQRVALARALARRPQILLLDEPLAALDRKLREETQFALKDIQRTVGTTFVVVTHDQHEALSLADTIAVMRDGRIEQVGPPAALYERPSSRFVAGFIGETNIVEGTVRTLDDGGATIDTSLGPLAVRTRETMLPGSTVAVAIRPECIRLGDDAASASLAIHGTIYDASYRGADTLLRVRVQDGTALRVAVSGASTRAVGSVVDLHIASSDLWLLHA